MSKPHHLRNLYRDIYRIFTSVSSFSWYHYNHYSLSHKNKMKMKIQYLCNNDNNNSNNNILIFKTNYLTSIKFNPCYILQPHVLNVLLRVVYIILKVFNKTINILNKYI